MTSYLRQLVGRKVFSAWNNPGLKLSHEGLLPWCVRVRVTPDQSTCQPELSLDYGLLVSSGCLPKMTKEERHDWGQTFISSFETDATFVDTTASERGVSIKCSSADFNKIVLDNVLSRGRLYGVDSDLHKFIYSQNDGLKTRKERDTVVVEYSSPNIAKPFHAGHLRSTIIGNFIANINSALGHRVVRINYLGDWGTQFGLLGIAYQKYGNLNELENNPMQHLFELYVRINQEMASGSYEVGSKIYNEALEYFSSMEKGDTEVLKFWKMCKDLSVRECTKTYKRLGVEFDSYEGEAMYFAKALDFVKELGDNGLLEKHKETGVGYIDLKSENNGKELYANLMKSDGSTLYMTREIVSALTRKEKYGFDRIHYVVENGQSFHFTQLKAVLSKLGHDWINHNDELHVKFGLVEGMSTRKGKVVLLADILNEAQERMAASMNAKETTKLSSESEISEVADRLGVSAIVVQDLREKRRKNYRFDWDRMLQFKGDTGVFLQYTHARLCSLEAACGMDLSSDFNEHLLVEAPALMLVQQIARYDEAIHMAYSELEPFYVIRYLFRLCHLVSQALEHLKVKGQEAELATSRLMLFHASKTVLSNGLNLIGLEPVDKM